MGDHKVALVGMRGAGKSTLGMAAAARLGWAFVDTDLDLGAAVGMSAGAFLAARGEPEFRAREREVVLAALARRGDAVLALGGGAVTIPSVRAALCARGIFTVWLEAEAVVLVERVARAPGTRPPLTGLPLADEVGVLLAERSGHYQQVARDRLQTFPANVDACVAALLAKIAAASRAL